MKTFHVVVSPQETRIVKAKRVRVKSDNTLIFFNPRTDMTEQYLYGSAVVALFNPNQYQYFTECQSEN